MSNLLFFDLETTGVMYWKNGIHQLSGLVEIDGNVVEEFDIKVRPNPKCIVEPQALDVAGVTLEQINAYQDMRTGYDQFTSILGKYADKYNKQDKFHLVGYNNRGFDDPFLRAWFVQNGDNYFGSWFWSDSIDVMVLASDYCRGARHTMENFKLMTVAKHLGIQVDESKLHDALYDVRLTRQVFESVRR